MRYQPSALNIDCRRRGQGRRELPLCSPTAVERAGDTVRIPERGAGKAVSIPMPK